MLSNSMQKEQMAQTERLTQAHLKNQWDIAQLANNTKLQMKQQGLSGEFHKDIMKAVNQFTEHDIKEETKKLSDLQGAQGLITEAIRNGAATGFIAMDLVPVVSGLKRVNQQEFEAAGGSKSLFARVQRTLTGEATGQLPISDAKQLLSVLKVVGNATKQGVQDRATHRALQFQQAYPQFSKDDLYERFLPKDSPYRLDTVPSTGNKPGAGAPNKTAPPSIPLPVKRGYDWGNN
jgi:hypothetical protein